MHQFTGTGLKTRLYLLVLVAFVPVAALIFYIAEEQKKAETEDIFQKTLMLAQTAADEEHQQLESTRILLKVMADTLPAAGSRADRLSGLMTYLLQQTGEYAELGIADPGGRLLIDSDPSGIVRADRDYSDKTWFSACLQSRELVMGPYQGEHIGGDPVLYVALPVRDSRQRVTAVVFAALNLDWINRNIFKQLAELPAGSRLTLLDNAQGMLRYDVNAGRWSVPEGFDPSLGRKIIQRRTGTLSAADEKNVMRIYAFAPLASSLKSRQSSVVLEIPEAVALAASKRTFLRNIALLLASAVITLVCLWWAGEVFILRRIKAMAAASRRLAAGDLGARIGKIGAPDELGHLAGVFDEMATSLQGRIEREEQVKASLKQSREQIRKLAAYQQEVREQERTRIAREIHDQFGQSLTILKMDLAWIKKHLLMNMPAVEEKIGAMSRVIDDSLHNLHAVTAELRPIVLDDFGLAAAIEWQVEEFRKHSGISCRMVNNGYEPVLPKDQATALFRVFQEVLTNILRHAQADDVEIRLEQDSGDLMLQVRDNGRGIKEDEINDPQSYGLLGIRERLYPWNGRVTFEGRPGRGTIVTVRFPMVRKGDRNSGKGNAE